MNASTQLTFSFSLFIQCENRHWRCVSQVIPNSSQFDSEDEPSQGYALVTCYVQTKCLQTFFKLTSPVAHVSNHHNSSLFTGTPNSFKCLVHMWESPHRYVYVSEYMPHEYRCLCRSGRALDSFFWSWNCRQL